MSRVIGISNRLHPRERARQFLRDLAPDLIEIDLRPRVAMPGAPYFLQAVITDDAGMVFTTPLVQDLEHMTFSRPDLARMLLDLRHDQSFWRARRSPHGQRLSLDIFLVRYGRTPVRFQLRPIAPLRQHLVGGADGEYRPPMRAGVLSLLPHREP